MIECIAHQSDGLARHHLNHLDQRVQVVVGVHGGHVFGQVGTVALVGKARVQLGKSVRSCARNEVKALLRF